MPPTPTPAPAGPRDVTSSCSVDQLLELRGRALELAHARVTQRAGGSQESEDQRRRRITGDAAAYVEFLLAGKVYGA